MGTHQARICSRLLSFCKVELGQRQEKTRPSWTSMWWTFWPASTLGQVFDGHTSCRLIVREGTAMLVEFDYAGKLTPSLPMIEPLQESFFAWLMKVRMLTPAYLAVLKGGV
jgi:hypothetical protein